MIVANQKVSNSKTKRKRIFNLAMFWKCLLLFALLSIIAYGILICFYVKNVIEFGQLKANYSHSIDIIEQLKTNNSHSKQIIEELKRQSEQLYGKSITSWLI
jgi:uncharacterized protein with PQ loop repeat